MRNDFRKIELITINAEGQSVIKLLSDVSDLLYASHPR